MDLQLFATDNVVSGLAPLHDVADAARAMHVPMTDDLRKHSIAQFKQTYAAFTAEYNEDIKQNGLMLSEWSLL